LIPKDSPVHRLDLPRELWTEEVLPLENSFFVFESLRVSFLFSFEALAQPNNKNISPT
jgi:hypothetical protein